jgi:hypothetical protein
MWEDTAMKIARGWGKARQELGSPFEAAQTVVPGASLRMDAWWRAVYIQPEQVVRVRPWGQIVYDPASLQDWSVDDVAAVLYSEARQALRRLRASDKRIVQSAPGRLRAALAKAHLAGLRPPLPWLFSDVALPRLRAPDPSLGVRRVFDDLLEAAYTCARVNPLAAAAILDVQIGPLNAIRAARADRLPERRSPLSERLWAFKCRRASHRYRRFQ